MSFFKKIFSKENKETLDKGLEKSKESFFGKLTKAVAGKSKVDEDVLDNLEEVLIASDVGVDTTLKIINRIEVRVDQDKYVGTDELNKILREEIAGLLSETNLGDETEFTIPKNKSPFVIMVVGVNGVGKTTTIGNLATLTSILLIILRVVSTPTSEAIKTSSRSSKTSSSTLDFPATTFVNLPKKLALDFSNPLSKVSFFSFENIFLKKLIFIIYDLY